MIERKAPFPPANRIIFILSKTVGLHLFKVVVNGKLATSPIHENVDILSFDNASCRKCLYDRLYMAFKWRIKLFSFNCYRLRVKGVHIWRSVYWYIHIDMKFHKCERNFEIDAQFCAIRLWGNVWNRLSSVSVTIFVADLSFLSFSQIKKIGAILEW